ncbi:hypothetical protein HPB50_006914 [Hyalomma asiaticum]|uniref:Uncharacterized protein n=1 Tax=Hyalomma asiaticum TaxID=266040 RepID=A0ACB7RXQ0_HYAAI|nr:hypothetical protein HPB50_006914 [Hyalomma asiaticum]
MVTLTQERQQDARERLAAISQRVWARQTCIPGSDTASDFVGQMSEPKKLKEGPGRHFPEQSSGSLDLEKEPWCPFGAPVEY